jgi:prevent-host-death family protein
MMTLEMRTVNVHEAKTRLSTLLAAVEDGEEVVIARSGRPVARLIRYESPDRIIGIDDDRLGIADDFDEFIPPGFEPYHGRPARREYDVPVQDAAT